MRITIAVSTEGAGRPAHGHMKILQQAMSQAICTAEQEARRLGFRDNVVFETAIETGISADRLLEGNRIEDTITGTIMFEHATADDDGAAVAAEHLHLADVEPF